MVNQLQMYEEMRDAQNKCMIILCYNLVFE